MRVFVRGPFQQGIDLGWRGRRNPVDVVGVPDVRGCAIPNKTRTHALEGLVAEREVVLVNRQRSSEEAVHFRAYPSFARCFSSTFARARPLSGVGSFTSP